MTDLSEMIRKAKAMLKYSYKPYSGFAVGACIKTTKQQVFAGCNVENASYGLTICAEASAIAMMVAAGEKQIAEIVVVADSEMLCAPCGACRQRIREFATPTTLIHFGNSEGSYKTMTIDQLLPEAFGPDNLQIA